MSTLQDIDSANNPKQGFKPSVPPGGPITTKGHQPGRKVSEADQRSEFHAEAHPQGTAPASSSYTANPVSEAGGQANNPNVYGGSDKEPTYTSAADTLMGSTSADVDQGLGKPLQGQTSVELRHDGQHGRKKQTAGLEGVGASAQDRDIERRFPDQRGLEREEADVSGTRGDKASRAAEEMVPESAETLSREWKYEPGTKRDKGQQRKH
ncbi:hypothetical protein N7499_005494 [Penicillium canescens]|uniref:Uncharacterized protein n=1 Tax=Penicillium canescens TaxID=5083 RepID=A0AAD6IDP7_PENCN|nr:uncharacterized protein N7446_001260 [Penicillium canescens]KAJ5998127.1 hypothetical protein N7522_009787 [Penicillium canescens]KAJ6043064.1 hypothetical protein N7460_004419 [Penicillium canescens]KAJ6054540.1 hypothetical protein N7444_003638 [Penicillium canescens]KAJ6073483.1 hypothetical protein N7446_001260 [Penicillium canescens]KAJ6080620.1 hypothetical protein N7499_005494 [Penicillium canescens]